ncbi:calcium-activated BK potassium channel [Cavenderia fasciculata]|uniref:Calcium-activated BK potassium channel n=1 Tax=Cavenderia fasciculata TaxID=261658 RepID=F4PN45_CACFS|nr:calcium-activated BK potassium channel [Cavenderia fasciculata]EGG23735.1 calcium-activated BK potassium channel [Cavenderia fasciculata]|eukprot:XP_004361586.1 calcium-activated BK potassium channel [Cavenderia fasciculata]
MVVVNNNNNNSEESNNNNTNNNNNNNNNNTNDNNNNNDNRNETDNRTIRFNEENNHLINQSSNNLVFNQNNNNNILNQSRNNVANSRNNVKSPLFSTSSSMNLSSAGSSPIGGTQGATSAVLGCSKMALLPVDERMARCEHLLREDNDDDDQLGLSPTGHHHTSSGLFSTLNHQHHEESNLTSSPINSFDSESDSDIKNHVGGHKTSNGGGHHLSGGVEMKTIKESQHNNNKDEEDKDSSDEEDDEENDSDIELEDQLDAEYLQNEENQQMERLARLRKYHHIYKEADFWLEHINILLSVVSVGLFIAMSYVDVDGKTWYDLNFIIFGLSLYFVFDFVRLLVFSGDRIHFLTKRETLIDVVSLLPIFVTLLPNTIVNVIPLAFLRVLRILKAPRLFKLYGANTVTQKTAQLILSILIVILLFASMFTSVEGVPFHTSLYFAVVTLSTVGYGDVTPQSILGRMLTITMIILTLVYLPLMTSELLHNLSNNRPWHRSYKTKKDFVAIAGNISEKSLTLFSKEYFFNSRIAKQTPLVVFCPDEPPSYINQLKAKLKISKYLIYIKGSCGVQDDIHRSNIKNSLGLFLFSRQSIHGAKEEDEDNLLRVMALRSFAPKIPIYVQMMTPRYKQKFLDAGASQVINIQELKFSILAQSCLSPGFSTLIMNLLRSDGNKKEIDGYGAGKMYEIFTCRFSSAFEGMTFKEAAKLIFEKLGMIVFGVEMVVQKKPKIKLIPTRDYLIKETDSAILLAKNKVASRRVRICTKEFLQQPSSLYQQQQQQSQSQDEHDQPASSQNFNMDTKVIWTYEPITKRYICQLKLTPRKQSEFNTKKHRKTLHKLIIEKKKELNHDMSVLQTIHQTEVSNTMPLSQLFPREWEESNSNNSNNSNNSSAASSTSPLYHHHQRQPSNDLQSTNSTIKHDFSFYDIINQESNTSSANSSGIVGDSGENTVRSDIHSTMTIPEPPPPPPPTNLNSKTMIKPKRFWAIHSLVDQLLSSVEDMHNINNHIILAGNPTNVEFFIRPLREDYLRRYDPIVLLTPTPIKEEDWAKICRYPDVYVVIGRPSSVTDVKRAGISKCSKFVVLKGEVAAQESIITDKEILVTVLGIKPLIQNNLIYPIFELIDPANMRFFVGNGNWNQNDPYYTAPSFASGSVFLSETFDCLLGQCYLNRHILTLVELLVSKASYNNNNSNNNDTAGSRTKIFQVEVPEMFVNQRFGYLFECLVDCNIFCLGLYRYDEKSSNHYNAIIINYNKSEKKKDLCVSPASDTSPLLTIPTFLVFNNTTTTTDNNNLIMEESNKQELLKFLNIFQHLGMTHLKTLNGFLQRPISSLLTSSIANTASIPLFEAGAIDGDEARSNRKTVYNLMQTLDKANEDQVDTMVNLVTKQLRQQLDQSDLQSAVQLATQLSIPLEYIEAIGKLYQSFLCFESVSVHLTEDHLSKITDALVSVFPLSPLEDPQTSQTLMGQSNTNVVANSPESQLKIQNYITILQKLQQLFTTTRIDSIMHLHQEINNGHIQQQLQLQQGTSYHQYLHQQICETLDLKNDEYYLATALHSLLHIDESSLISLIDSFPKLKSLQLAQLAHLPFKNVYEVLDMRSNLCSLTSTYGYFANQQQNSSPNYTFPIIDPTKSVQIKIVEQPPEKAVYKRNVKPAPSVMFDGDSKLLDGNYYVACTLLRCNTFQEEPGFLIGNKTTPFGSSKVVTFKKLKVLVTSHQQGETLFCFRFDLRRYRSDYDTNPNDFEVVSSIHSNPICLLSHSTQLKHTANVDLPQVVEAIPLSGTSSGGTRVAVLGSNFADTPATRIKFDNAEVVPTFHSQGTLLCYTPEHAPGTVQVRVSNSPKHWSNNSAVYTYEDERTIALRNAREETQMNVPKSSLGIDFMSTFTSSFIIKGSDSNMTNLPSGGGAMRTNYPSSGGNRYNLHATDARGFALLHYLSVFAESDQKYAEMFVQVLQESSTCGLLHVLDKFGNTALHWATIFECVAVVRALLAKGVSSNVQNLDGITPLHLAVAAGNIDIAKMMLSTGANVTLGDIDGSSALHFAATARCNSRELTALLLSCGANLYARDDEDETSLHHAVRNGSGEVVALLLQAAHYCESIAAKTASVSSYPYQLVLQDEPFHSLQNEDGETPLHIAAATNNIVAMELLLRSGARSDIMDNDGQTALHLHIESIKRQENNNNTSPINNQDNQIILNLFIQKNNFNQPQPMMETNNTKETIYYNPTNQVSKQIYKYLKQQQDNIQEFSKQNQSRIDQQQYQTVNNLFQQQSIF